jgi:hypothetical protein
VETAEIAIDGRKTWLAKSLRFMNESGPSYASIAKKHDVTPDHVIAVHDEIDLPFGALKVKIGGSTAGHNGLKLLQQSLRTPDFLRVRVGVGRPPGRQDPADYVLQPFAKPADVAIDAADAVRSSSPRARGTRTAQLLRRPRLMGRVIGSACSERLQRPRCVERRSIPAAGGGRSDAARRWERLQGEQMGASRRSSNGRARPPTGARGPDAAPRRTGRTIRLPATEQRPYAELARWREVNGPDIPIGLDRTASFETVAGPDYSSSARANDHHLHDRERGLELRSRRRGGNAEDDRAGSW